MAERFTNNCKKLRKLMSEGTIMMPGAFNGQCGRLAAENGFQAVYVSGAAVTGKHGVPDIGVLTLNQFCDSIKQVAMASNLPIIADADTGFGEAEMVHKTVWEYYLHGASGLHIEDQVFPKRCGHLDGKTLISREDMVKKVQLAKQASIECSGGEFIICARTDARGVLGIEETIIRSKMFVEAGADMIFPEGLKTVEEFKQVADALKGVGSEQGPFLLANMTEFGKTPYITVDEFAKLGYHCVIYPVSTLRIANKAIDLFLKDLKANGTQKGQLENMQTRQELYDTLGYTPGKEWYYPSSTHKGN